MTADSPGHLHSLLPELAQLERMIAATPGAIRSERLIDIEHWGHKLPLYACHLGSDHPGVPLLVFVGGVHGLERIGSQVVLAFMETLVERLDWDLSLNSGLQNLKLLFLPLVNPAGVLAQTRSNAQGIDLMRNAPVEADSRVPFLIGGHRLGPAIPWYRGRRSEGLQPEVSAIYELLARETASAPFTLLIDVHSGYGFQDRLWFPLACSRRPIQHLPEIFALYQLLERTYPNLDYVFEPQSRQYLTHGDMWDYLYLQQLGKNNLFLPITLEMGSWNWIKKNPLQLRRVLGMFNPVKPHRTQRVLRRHTILLEFLIRAARAYRRWLPEEHQRAELRALAEAHWYR